MVIDDGATHNEVFALVTDGEDEEGWDNQVYVAHEDEEMTVDLGGLDYVFLGDDEANTVTVDVDQILKSESGMVNVSGIEGDNLVVTGDSGDAEAIGAAYDTVKSTADSATISWGKVEGGIEVSITVFDDEGGDLLAQTHMMQFEIT